MIFKKKLAFAYLSSKKYLLLADKYILFHYVMDSERTVKTTAEQLEALTKENERLKQELSALKIGRASCRERV